MIEILILYQLNKKILTMYGISKGIRTEFSVLTSPSFGTIKPALMRLEKKGFIKSQKTLSDGGRPSVYYSITKDGEKAFEEEILAPVQDNPIQFLTTARVRLICSQILDFEIQRALINILKTRTKSLIAETNNIIVSEKLDFNYRMVLDNLICEFKNFENLLEGFERAGNN